MEAVEAPLSLCLIAYFNQICIIYVMENIITLV